MDTTLIAGGNSGIGLRTARELLDAGHRVVLLGRDPRKGEEALASFGAARDRASFHAVDLSTDDGVRAAAETVLKGHQCIDALVHTTGVFTSKEIRTADGLTTTVAVNYLSRYHLTQLLLPALRAAEHPRVVMMTARLSPAADLDFTGFPEFRPYEPARVGKLVHLGNHLYAAHLARTEPGFLTGVVNAGGASTDIMRSQPWWMRATAKLLIPLLYNSIEESAHNAVQAAARTDWPTATYWDKPGTFTHQTLIFPAEATVQKIMTASHKITGA
ncbi:SDR family NAD(P)-dependent oxidoreductase [Glycomyces sp. NPDC047010]|uniref:SDR family NAD(P)-dependent oxidoreductase n=1 Tax=Glycomyces sp. NPDC047010 TaxID=3155023 RepID=UPI0033D72A33